MGFGTEWATPENEEPIENNLHIRGTIETQRGRQFWLTRPHPKGVDVDEWERLEQEKWDRIFSKKEVL